MMSVFARKPLLSAILAGSGLALAACGPGSGSTSTGLTRLSIEALTPSGASARQAARDISGGEPVEVPVFDRQGAEAGVLTLDSAWLVVEEVDLERDDEDDSDDDDSDDDGDGDDDDDEDIEFAGPFVVNLLNASTDPALPSLEIRAGRYSEIEIELESLDDDDVDADGNRLMDRYPQLGDEYTVYLSGTYNNGDSYQDIDFEMRFDDDVEYELSGQALNNGFDIDSVSVNELVIVFRMADWFRFDSDNNDDSVEFEQAVRYDPGSGSYFIRLDSDEDDIDNDVMEVIEDNIEDSADFDREEDDDDDGNDDDDN